MALTEERKKQLLQQAAAMKIAPVSSTPSGGLTEERKRALLEQANQMGIKPTQNEGFLKSTARSILTTPAKVGVGVTNLFRSAVPLAKGIVADSDEEKLRLANEARKELDSPRNLPFLGRTEPITKSTDTGNELVKKSLGAGLELGSYIPAAGAAKAVTQGLVKGAASKILPAAIEGAAGGFMAGTGSSLAQGKGVKESVETGAETALIGGALGGAFSAARPLVTKAIPDATKTLLSKMSGLDRDTIETVINRAPEIKQAREAGVTREMYMGGVKNKIDDIRSSLSDLGSLYNPVRELETNFVVIPKDKDIIGDVLSKYNIGTNKGKLVFTNESAVLSDVDKKALQDFYTENAKEKVMSGNAFLNTRERLARLANYDSRTRDTLERIAGDIRSEYNVYGKKQLPGLRELDEEYAPLRQFFKKDIQQFIDKDGEVKMSKVVSALKNPNKSKELKSLEKFYPDAVKDFEILASLEDVTLAGEKFKVGTYANGLLSGGSILSGAAGGATLGVPGVIGGLLLSNPKFILNALETYGLARSSALGALKSAADKTIPRVIEKIRSGVKVNADEAKTINKAITDILENPKRYENLDWGQIINK